MRMRIVFTRSSGIIAGLVRWFTWSEYNHVAIGRAEGTTLIEAIGWRGVVLSNMYYLRSRSTVIKVMEVEVLRDPTVHLRSQLGKKYDYSGILGIWFRRNWQEENRWFCSELVAWACAKAGTPLVVEEKHRITPNDILTSPLLDEVPSDKRIERQNSYH
ncbi:MAG: hypothetical protein KAJ73_00405 [Zetaproteobacteria bacterium]|nr:hypothetical protein [Zetaproteobacteria bacterium]